MVHRGAFQLTLESTLYCMINEGHVTTKNAERMANELLDSMETGPEGYDCVDNETVNNHSSNNNTNNNNEDDTLPAVPTAGGSSAVDSATLNQEKERRRMDESDTKRPAVAAAEDHEKWAAPRSRAGSNRPSGSNQEKSRKNERVSSARETAEAAAAEGTIAAKKMRERALFRDRRDGPTGDRSGDHQIPLEPCLGQVLETHRRTCTRYANQVAELEAQNAGLAAAAAEASRLEAEAAAQTRQWETKHDALEARLAEVERRSREELALAEKRADEARSQTLEAADELKETLERATPTLLELVAGFAPRDTEGPGVDLFRSLGTDPDLYVHLLATKRMFEVRACFHDELVASCSECQSFAAKFGFGFSGIPNNRGMVLFLVCVRLSIVLFRRSPWPSLRVVCVGWAACVRHHAICNYIHMRFQRAAGQTPDCDNDAYI